MLQNIRQNIQGTAAKIVVGLIVVSFSIFGIESILLGGGGGGVAEVNGEEITPQELQQTVNTQKRRLIAMMGENLDPAMLDDDRISAQALETLISRKLLTQAAADLDLAVSEREIGRVIGSMEQFQIDGKFSPEVYRSVLSSAGYTPGYFKQSLRQDLMVNQLQSGLAGSDFATPEELELTARIVYEQRDVRYLTIPRDRFMPDPEAVTQAQVESYYAANQSEFASEESVDLDYIELTPDDFRQPVDESEIREAYELALHNGQYGTENRVSHILFERGEEESREALQQRIDTVREKLAAGEDFASVAAEYSDDIGSSRNGGDLGFSAGDAFPEKMEEAIASLEPGTVSEPVETDAGIHLILVTERREAKPPSYEEMRPELEERIQLEEARVELLRTVEELRDLAFNAESLDAPAKELGLDVAREVGVTRSMSEGLFANPSLLSAAFSEEVLEAGHNSEVIEISGNQFVVLRVHKHKPADIQPLEQVRDAVVARIRESEATRALTAEAERIVAQLRAGVAMEQVANREEYPWQVELGADRLNMALPPEVLQRAFRLPSPTGTDATVDFVITSSGDAQVVEVDRVSVGEYAQLEGSQKQRLEQQVSAEYGGLTGVEFQQGLRESAEITTL
ncbi:MAG: SurA N-terminal domain-containing protein [Halioglobus sp.]